MDGDSGTAILGDPVDAGEHHRDTLATDPLTIPLLGTRSGPANPGASPTLVPFGW